MFLYCVDIVSTLHFTNVTPDKPYHAALVVWRTPLRPQLHDHDFWEMVFVLEGVGLHVLGADSESDAGGNAQPLHKGTLVLVRPHDRHTFQTTPGAKLHFINLAFPEARWHDFLALAEVGNAFKHWQADPLPPSATLTRARFETCTTHFRGILAAFEQGASALELCRYWSSIIPYLLEGDNREAVITPHSVLPLWLVRACRAMENDTNLRLGRPRLLEIADVSSSHLSRTMHSTLGVTPTEFINELRLQRAALLLRTSSREIIDVASDCGFDNLSYFYRSFRFHYGQTPRRYRLEASCNVFP